MKINQDKVIKYLNSQPHTPTCPLCGNSKLVVSETAYQLPEYNKSSFENKKVFPVIPVICDECGYTFFVNALACKAVEPNKGELDNDSKKE